MNIEPDVRKLTVHEELEVEQRFYTLLNSGYIPDGLADVYLKRMLLHKASEIEAMIERS